LHTCIDEFLFAETEDITQRLVNILNIAIVANGKIKAWRIVDVVVRQH
jgi:hypothetical protein